MIPKKFSENLREKLPQMVVLKGPGGATRDVQLERAKNATLFFKDGWKEFAKAHHFMENDLLMFKYNRDSCFKVRVFDGKNLCENVGSYFVRNFASTESAEGRSSQAKRKKRESSVEVLDDEDDSDYEGSGSEWAPTGTWKKKGRRDPSTGSRRREAELRSPSTPHAPNRRTPNAEEKERALQMAMREVTPDSFVVVMKAAHISPYHRLCIPAPWSRNHLLPKNQHLELRVNEKRWTTRLNIQHRSGAAIIISGWFNFTRDNSLLESDVCVFKLSSKINDIPAILDVHIFRASAEAVQLTPPPHKLSPA
ncbi:hypothetical protein Cgig2_015096 [Carnegiea gigantea]|uniref:TF-B3 domain-containing protein n=1 Tax=Carnegiea gigantea TaxID=171969 RepID=A0A9Q1QM43_9CARY|nr:hypothetical protein Cgig2_015096 [Carnegiea gigantea]